MIDLTPLFPELPEEKIKELQIICQRIIDTKMADIIILFGSYARGDYKLQRGEDRGKQSDFDILIITSNEEYKKDLSHELFGRFNNVLTPVQKVIEDIRRVNLDLMEKRYFFTDICHEGKVLYNSGRFELAEAVELSKEIAEEDFKYWYGQAKDFWELYLSSYEMEKYRLCSFLLQQVVEMCYTAIEMVFNQYNPHEHDLYELRDRITVFNPRFDEPFPLTSQELEDSFDHLNLAYIGGRYHSEKQFQVTNEQLNYWSAEAEKLMKLTKEICQEKIAGM